jgi:hypothetical protein
VNLKTLSVNDHQYFIIERVLEYGDLESFLWIRNHFKKSEIVKVLKNSKKISPKTGNFYALYFGVPKKELLCIRKPFTQKQNRF